MVVLSELAGLELLDQKLHMAAKLAVFPHSPFHAGDRMQGRGVVPVETPADRLEGLIRVLSCQEDGHLPGFDDGFFPGTGYQVFLRNAVMTANQLF